MSTDIFDSVIDFEQQEYAKGDADGRKDAIDSGEMLDNGRQSGFLKGLAYGLEVGFYKAVAEQRLRDLELPASSSTTTSTSTSSTTSSSVPLTQTNLTRVAKWSTQLTQRTNAFPVTNINPFDFDNEIRELRGLHRLCGSQVGPFRPVQPPTSTTATSTVRSTDVAGSTDNPDSSHVFVTITAAAHDW